MMGTQHLKQSLGALAGFWLHTQGLKGQTLVFTFHRVLPLAEFNACQFQRSLVVSDRSFEIFLRYISAHFDVITMSRFIETRNDLLGHHPRGQNARPQALITFDDGWRDNYDVALPLLTKYALPATVFLSTDYIESDLGFWWQTLGDFLSSSRFDKNTQDALKKIIADILQTDRVVPDCFSDSEHFIETLKRDHYTKIAPLTAALFEHRHSQAKNLCLTWAHCETMSRHGIEFGSHTCGHPRLSLLSPEARDHELRESKHCLTQHRLNYVNALCYPYGDYDKKTQQQAAEFYHMGFSTRAGLIKGPDTNWFSLPRIHVSDELAKEPSRLNYRILRAAWSRPRLVDRSNA